MLHSIKQLFHIDAKRNDVFKSISTIEGLMKWWTTETSGRSSPGEIIHFRFGKADGPDMKVIDFKPGESIEWKFVANPHGWTGHTFTFELDNNDGKTRVRFTHDGWAENDDFYAICTFSWAPYMESLRQLYQTGKGEAFGSEGYKQ
ncbi:hypothetical protein BH10BAC3_BH10BAC3_20140 [soil metagenome]